jgi:hypothetical protein
MKVKDFNKLQELFLIIVLLYTLVATYFFISRPAGGGDELLFIKDLQSVKENGWLISIQNSVSIPYMLLALPFSYFLENFIALRLVNIILVFFLFGYFYKREKKGNIFFFPYLLFYISAAGFYYSGTNGALFFIALIIFFNEIHRCYNENDWSPNLALSALIIAVFTRELYLVYLPVIVLGLYLLLKNRYNFNHKSLIPVVLFLVLLTMNIPSLLKSGTISYDRNSPPQAIEANWSQRQYLAQLKVNKGEQKNMQHPSWEETEDYLKVYGKDSLPDGVIKGMTHDFKLTISEFFKDLWYIIIFHPRSMGLMLIISMSYWGWEMIQRKKLLFEKNFIPMITLIMIMIFSLIIISFVEIRWLSPVFIMCIVYYNFLEKGKKIPNLIIKTNLIFLSFVMVYGLYGLIERLY